MISHKLKTLLVLVFLLTLQACENDGGSEGGGSKVYLVVPDAGRDQYVTTGTHVVLDGRNSSAQIEGVDGTSHSTTYEWVFTELPVGSQARLSDPTQVSPTFIPDLDGNYTLSLKVNRAGKLAADEQVIFSKPTDTVSIYASSDNTLPNLFAGIDLQANLAALVFLNGSDSRNSDGAEIAYQWAITQRPTGSFAELLDANSAQPSLQPDLAGDYVIELTDEVASDVVDTVNILVKPGNSIPVANAGPDQMGATVGSTVTLNGSGSADFDGDSLNFHWYFKLKPQGSTVTLKNSSGARPSFKPDVAGTYVAALKVNDGKNDSVMDSVMVVAQHQYNPPTCSIDASTTVALGADITLNGEADFGAATYLWRLKTMPSESLAALTTPYAASTKFTADKLGDYVAELTVQSGYLSCGPKEVRIKSVDKTPPVITLIGINPIKVKIGSTYIDPGATAWDEIDGDLTSKIRISTFNTGYVSDHKVTYSVSDAAGNEARVTRDALVRHTIPPFATLISNQDNPTNQTNATFSFSANENSTFECSLDGEAHATCSSPITYTDLSAGNHTFHLRATDPIGNVDTAESAWIIDTTPPVTTINNAPSSPTNQANASFSFSADGASSFECSLDDSDFTSCSSPITYTELSAGDHTFRVRATDPVGNVETAKSFSWIIDTIPIVTIDVSPANPTNETNASFSFSANESSTFECSLDGSDFSSCTSPLDFSDLNEAAHIFRVKATDLTGNVGASENFSWTIDTTPPVITLIGASTIEHDIGTPFVDPGATAIDAIDGNVSTSITTSGSVNDSISGAYSLTYNVTDEAGNSAIEAIRLVNVFNSPPVAQDQTVTAVDGEAKAIILTATDANNNALTYAVGTPAHGQLTGEAPNLTYSQTGACESVDSFTFTVNDGEFDSAAATITIDVVCPHAIVADDQPSVSVISSGSVDITLTATDSLGHVLTYQLTTNPTQGALSGQAPNVTYTTDAACSTTDSFEFKAVDDNGFESIPATVTINIVCPDLDIGGTVSGLESNALILDLNGTQILNLDSDGNFVFDTQIPHGSSYAVTVHTQPSGLNCSVFNGNGVAKLPVSNIVVTCLPLGAAIFEEHFDSDWEGWSVDNGVWEVGVPTRGPDDCHSGTQCAATVLAGAYPAISSRLISPSIILPSVTTGEELELSFWHWFVYGSSDEARLEIQEETAPDVWGEAVTLHSFVGSSGDVWSKFRVNLSAYANKKVRIRFYSYEGGGVSNNYGWYVDDVAIKVVELISTLPYTENFESSGDDWWVDNGVWEIGAPSSQNPKGCHTGTQCAATVLAGAYPTISSRLISPSIILPSVTTGEELELSFWHWFAYGSSDEARLEIQEETAPDVWSEAVTLNSFVGNSGGVWSKFRVDLSAYANKKVRIRFYSYDGGGVSNNYGWYIDDVAINVIEAISTLPYTEGFESNGGDDWWVTNGVWEIGVPTRGPDNCQSGTQCAATILGGIYPAISSRFISPSIILPSVTTGQGLQLSFWHWFAYGSSDQARLELQEETAPGEWGEAVTLNSFVGNSGGVWSQFITDLSAYANKKIRIRFYSYDGGGVSNNYGWYLDDLLIEVQVSP